MRPSLEVRLAKNSEGDIIRQILTDTMDMDLKQLNWSKIEPYWLVAVYGDEIVACVQILIGYPVGIIEFLGFKEGLNDMQKARIIKLIAKRALAGFMDAEVTAVASSVPFFLKSFKNILKRKWGATVYSSGSLLMKILVDKK